MGDRLLRYIHSVMAMEGIKNDSELAKRLGTTPQNLANKFKRNDLRVSEIEAIANVMDMDVVITFVKRQD